MFHSVVAAVPVLSEAGHHVVNELPIPAWGYGAIALSIFGALLLVLVSFGNASNRHAAKADANHEAHDGDAH